MISLLNKINIKNSLIAGAFIVLTAALSTSTLKEKREPLEIRVQKIYHPISKKQAKVTEEADKEQRISQSGIDLIKEFEGFEPNAYLCPAKKWTIGYGTTLNVNPEDTITRGEAEKLLDSDTDRFEKTVNDYVKVPLTQNQYDALVSFTYNIGQTAFKESTFLKKLNNKNYVGASTEFPRWNKSKGKVLRGLVRRRKREKELFNRG